MRTLLTVVQAPIADLLPGVCEISEPVFIQTLIPEFSVKALDVTILHRLSGLNQLQFNAMTVGPLIECFASEFRPLVGSNGFRVASEGRNAIQGTGYLFTRDAHGRGNVEAFLGEVIHDRQAFDPAPVGQGIHHEVHGPRMIRCIGQHQGLSFHHHTFTALAFSDGQACLPVKPINLLVIHLSSNANQGGIHGRSIGTDHQQSADGQNCAIKEDGVAHTKKVHQHRRRQQAANNIADCAQGCSTTGGFAFSRILVCRVK